MPLRRDRGSILVVALWTLFALSMMAVVSSRHVWPCVDFSGKMADRVRLRYFALAAAERGMLEVENLADEKFTALSGTWSNNEEAFKDVPIGDGRFSLINMVPSGSGVTAERKLRIRYGLADEEGRININRVPSYVLKNLFEIVGGASSGAAAEIAAAVIDWREKSEAAPAASAKSFHYLTLDPPYECKSADLQMIEELMLVKGMTPAIFNNIKEYITIYGNGSVNINTADATVMRVLGMDESMVYRIISFRNGPDGQEGTADDRVFKDVFRIREALASGAAVSGPENSSISLLIGDNLLSVRSDNFRAHARGDFGNSRNSFVIVFVFDRAGKTVRYWREE